MLNLHFYFIELFLIGLDILFVFPIFYSIHSRCEFVYFLGFHPERNMYHTIAKNLFDFLEIDAIPIALKKRFASSASPEELSQMLMKEKAGFHKSCISTYNKQKLERKRKSYEKQSAENDNDDGEEPSKKLTRQNTKLRNFSELCFFCDENIPQQKLHECMSLSISNRVKAMANALGDTRLLAKLIEGDMIATEAKYHSKCFLNLFNRHRNLMRQTEQPNKEYDFIEGMKMFLRAIFILRALLPPFCMLTENNVISKYKYLFPGVALTEIAGMIEDVINSAEKSPVFLLKDLVKMYKDKLLHLGATEDFTKNLHSTRFKEAVLKRVEGLCEKKHGKNVLLTLEEDVGHAVFEASQSSSFDEGIILCKAAKIIRKHLFSKEEVFDGDLTKQRQISSVPKELIHLVSLILEGTSQYDKISGNTQKIAINLSQLLRFNAVKSKRKMGDSHTRHSTTNEPPLPAKIGLLIHAKTRKKSIVDDLAAEGLSVTYKRVQQIQETIGQQLCEKYANEGIVCPPILQRNLFTFAAIDNVDHNPSSSTATSSFHGTSITIFQQVEGAIIQDPFIMIKSCSDKENAAIKLPEYYNEIIPSMGGKPEPPRQVITSQEEAPDPRLSSDNFEWLRNLEQFHSSSDDLSERFSFSAYHSQKMKEQEIAFKTQSALLPVLLESVNSPAMVRHCMDVIKKLTLHLNPSQSRIIITGDQPVYALGKQVQWNYPDQFPDIFWMMGPLHIEMAFLDAIGNWLDGSGWVDVFERAKISTTGRIESFLNGRKVKRTRYAHQVSLASLLHLSMLAFEKHNTTLTYSEWKANHRAESVNAEYWFTAMEMESLYFMLVRSLRIGDFDSFLICLIFILPWFFALDHTQYSRWMSVFVNDLSVLEMQQNGIYDVFVKGYFTVRKSNRVFSNMGIDQAHEQNNKILKADGGVIGILDNPTALLKWAISGPVISQMLNEERTDNIPALHHEDTSSHEKHFRQDRDAFIASMLDYGNPFEEEEQQLVHISSRHLLDEVAAKSVRKAQSIGKDLHAAFVTERLESGNVSLYETVKRNNLALFRQKHVIKLSKSKQKIVSLNSERRLYANLYEACQSREGDLDNFFAHENHTFPVSISEYGKLRKCTSKSHFLQCVESMVEVKYDEPEVLMKMIDGAAFVHMNPPKSSSTYGNYCQVELFRKIRYASRHTERLDIVFDFYQENSLKSQTRENRGEEIRVSVRKDTPICKNFQKFMRNDRNKTELFEMISTAAINIPETESKIVATIENQVVANTVLDTSRVEPCNHEEADTRLLLHVLDGAETGIRKISIVTVDTDVVVIALRHFFDLNLEELWIEFGTGRSRRFLPIHECANKLGERICDGLTLWFSITGCDTVSMFNGKGKKTAWKAWRSFDDGVDTFAR